MFRSWCYSKRKLVKAILAIWCDERCQKSWFLWQWYLLKPWICIKFCKNLGPSCLGQGLLHSRQLVAFTTHIFIQLRKIYTDPDLVISFRHHHTLLWGPPLERSLLVSPCGLVHSWPAASVEWELYEECWEKSFSSISQIDSVLLLYLAKSCEELWEELFHARCSSLLQYPPPVLRVWEIL